MTTDATQPLDVFEAVCNDFYAPAREAAALGTPIAGFACSYSPQEMVHAAGYMPVRILGRPGGTPQADEILQAYACSLARSSLDSGLAGELDFMDLAVFSHTCDTMQNVADLWQRNVPGMETLIVSMPNRTTGEAAHTYLRKELERVRTWLEERAGTISGEQLTASIALFQRHRTVMQRLYALRRKQPGLMTGAQMNAVVTASMLMAKEKHLALLTQLVDALETRSNGAEASDAPRILVSGSLCQNRQFISTLEASGCQVVDDDLCMGARSFTIPDAKAEDPIEALAGMYLERRPCPAFHTPGFDPGDHLVERAKQAQADGVVFLLTKFCDPWFFDYPHASKKLEAAGVPTLLLEIEQNQPVPEQFKTRAQAFFEMLEVGAA
ncbi:MAG: 2-hydroxyacyl-CoA dehydratase subunit D [Candidatus Hydrogenedentota bacterium]